MSSLDGVEDSPSPGLGKQQGTIQSWRNERSELLDPDLLGKAVVIISRTLRGLNSVV